MPDIVLCDDHPIFADALGVVLGRRGFTVKAIVHSTSEIVGTVALHRPQACVIDRQFGDGDGIAMIGHVRLASPSTKVLLLTADRDAETVARAMAAGASGYLCKTAGVASLVTTITRILDGETVVELPPQGAARRTPAAADAHRLAGHLTRRERECLALIVEGLGTRAITERLGVSTATVRTYVQAVLTKLGVHSRLEAASFAVRYALLDDAG